MKYQNYTILRVLISATLMLLIAACEKQNSTSNIKHYNNKGLELTYPKGWSLEHDSSGIIADRRIDFETPNLSGISIFFCKTNPHNYLDISNRFIKLNDLENEKKSDNPRNVRDLQREKVSVAGYEGLKLNWTENGLLGEEIKAEVTIFQLKSDPYPVLVQFYLFDNEIISLNSNIIPFLEGISFDPQGIKL